MAETLKPYVLDIAQAAALDAEEDAACVIQFLKLKGIDTSSELWALIVPDYLLDLGAVFRMLRWERLGFRIHRDEGLPSAHEAFGQLFPPAPNLIQRIYENGPLYYSVIRQISAHRFAWRGRTDFGANILLDVPNEDELVDAMAHLLWDYRHEIPTERASPS